MGDFVDSAARILSQSQERLELTAHNISNLATPGYKRQVTFSETLQNTTYGRGGAEILKTHSDFSEGKLVPSTSRTDLALTGDGFFALQANGQTLLTRNGQFTRDADGRLVNADGFALQAAGGGDLMVRTADFNVSAEGIVVEAGEPIGQIAVMTVADPTKLVKSAGGLYAAAEAEMTALASPSVRQGMLESSNVSMGDEMVTMMEAVRRAETAQRLINVYDDLMGRVITSFGQS